MPVNAIEQLIAQFTAKEEEARAANVKRQQQIESIFDEIIARYGPGGTYGAAAESLLARQKIRDVGAVGQRDISRGMYGVRPYEAEWEAEVGAPARLRLEDIKMERLSAAQMGKAGFMERVEEPYPEYGALLQAAQAAGAGTAATQAPATAYGAATTKGPSPWEPGFMGGGWTLGGKTTAAPVEPATGAKGTAPPGIAPQRYGVPAPIAPTAAPTTGGEAQDGYRAWQQGELANLEKRYAEYMEGGAIAPSTSSIWAGHKKAGFRTPAAWMSAISGGYGYGKSMISGVSREQWEKRTRGKGGTTAPVSGAAAAYRPQKGYGTF